MDISRNDLPDIDSDFSDQDKVRKYVIDKYGQSHVALLGAWQEIKLKTAIKDAYRVLRPEGSFFVVNALTNKLPDSKPGDSEAEFYFNLICPESKAYEVDLHQFMKDNPDIEKAVLQMLDKRKAVKPHACGMVISSEDIQTIIPTYLDNSQDESTKITTMPREIAEELGLVKFDILALEILKPIQECLKMIKQKKGFDLDIYNLPTDDKKVLAEFARGNTEKTHQYNTPLLTHYLKEMNVDSFDDLVAANALVRPGPLDSGYVETYIARKHGRIKLDEMKGKDGSIYKLSYDHPVWRECTKATYGILAYQEQLQLLFHKMGGFSLVEANTIRKYVSKKKKDKLAEAKDKFINHALENLEPKLSREALEELWADIENFGNYAFNLSHAAVYAYLGYVCQYLKVYYPVQYWGAVLKNATDNDVKIVSEAMPSLILQIDINKSEEKFVECDDKYITPFIFIKSVGAAGINGIIAARPFKDFTDFLDKVNGRGVNRKCILNLIFSEVFKSIDSRSEWELVEELFKARKTEIPAELLPLKDDMLALETYKKEINPFYKSLWVDKFAALFDSDVSKISTAQKLYKGEIKIGGTIKQFKKAKTKKGSDFGKMLIDDGVDEMWIMIWEEALEKYGKLCKVGSLVQVCGSINSYGQNKNLIMKSMKKINLEVV
jgi:DNA polymerase-3 subunit alpha